MTNVALASDTIEDSQGLFESSCLARLENGVRNYHMVWQAKLPRSEVVIRGS